jgi:hypothetical protein
LLLRKSASRFLENFVGELAGEAIEQQVEVL